MFRIAPFAGQCRRADLRFDGRFPAAQPVVARADCPRRRARAGRARNAAQVRVRHRRVARVLSRGQGRSAGKCTMGADDLMMVGSEISGGSIDEPPQMQLAQNIFVFLSLESRPQFRVEFRRRGFFSKIFANIPFVSLTTLIICRSSDPSVPRSSEARRVPHASLGITLTDRRHGL